MAGLLRGASLVDIRGEVLEGEWLSSESSVNSCLAATAAANAEMLPVDPYCVPPSMSDGCCIDRDGGDDVTPWESSGSISSSRLDSSRSRAWAAPVVTSVDAAEGQATLMASRSMDPLRKSASVSNEISAFLACVASCMVC